MATRVQLHSRGEAVAGFALVGAGLGARIGHKTKTDRWSEPITIGAPEAAGPAAGPPEPVLCDASRTVTVTGVEVPHEAPAPAAPALYH